MKTNMRSLVSRRLVSSMFGFAGLSLVFGSSLVLAQESGREVANVPFAFHAKDTALPEGTYTVKVINSLGLLQIADKKTGRSIIVPTRGRESGPAGAPRLTFHRYGNEYFLSEVWMPQQTTGYTVGKSAREKELAKQPGQLALASVSFQGE